MSVILDGTTDYWLGPNVQVASSKTGALSLWFKTGAIESSGAQALFTAWSTGVGATGYYLLLSISGTLDRIALIGRDAATATIFSLTKNSASLTDSTWYHLMTSWDVGNELGNMYLNGTDQAPIEVWDQDVVVPYSSANSWDVGVYMGSTGTASALFNGILDDLYFTTTYIDLSTAANRRLFYGREGTKVGLGHNGFRPTQSRPEILLTHGPNNYGQNAGTAGDFSTVGAPTFSRGRPAASNTLSRGFYGERWRESERSGIPFRDSQLIIEPASGLEVARREFSTDRDEINRRKRFGRTIFEH